MRFLGIALTRSVCRRRGLGTGLTYASTDREALLTEQEVTVGIGTSIFLIAVGAILRYAVTRSTVEGVDLDVVGLILMIVGVAGLVISFLWMTMWADRRRGAVVGERAVVREPVREREVVERDAY
jgi:Na+/melibiose symporter-like transporter